MKNLIKKLIIWNLLISSNNNINTRKMLYEKSDDNYDEK